MNVVCKRDIYANLKLNIIDTLKIRLFIWR